MWFIDWIIERFNNASAWSYELYLECYYTGGVLGILATPFYYLSEAFADTAWAFYYIGTWMVWVEDKISGILSAGDIWTYFEYWFSAAENAWNWVYNAVYNVWDTVNDWWTTTQYTVISWVEGAQDYAYTLFNQASALIASLGTEWDAFKGRIPTIDGVISWWSNWTGNLQVTIDTWWSGAVLEIQSLIDSAFIAREPFWAGWQDWRDKVVEFFTDPEQWLYNRLDSFFERFW